MIPVMIFTLLKTSWWWFIEEWNHTMVLRVQIKSSYGLLLFKYDYCIITWITIHDSLGWILVGVLIASYKMWAMGRNLAGRAALFSYRKLSSAARWYCLYKINNLFVRLFPPKRSAMWWIHIEDMYICDRCKIGAGQVASAERCSLMKHAKITQSQSLLELFK